ncbi:amidohydrolase [Nonlabens sp. YIK11]|uniref:amidohydrolase n=1 Tax=Nonlabens sp. YIK11 TaxID=1453349 RepID=UPI0006DC7313|nr:amidohydrolase [Nonlabens sp. YIK11]KQC34388.1 amidohydrolase [Nonlabens sp. YIK11]
MKNIFFLAIVLVLASCKNENADNYVDAIYTNGNIYTVDNAFSVATTMAVKDGKVFAVGSQDEIDALNLKSDNIIDLEGQYVYPGLIDAHCHFYRFGEQLQQVDLKGTTSYQEVLDKVKAFQEKNNKSYIIGRGWDQNDWDVKEYPTKAELTELFPNTPVALTRIDGHAMIVNQAALDLAGIDEQTAFSGGDIEQIDGQLTGILVDNPMELIEKTFPAASREADIEALMDAQEINFSYGLTTVDDAGLNRNTIELIDSLQQAGALKMKIYAMVSNTPENLDYYLDKGTIKTDRLNVRSIKFYADGALGSRGAAMKEEYSDRENHFGALLSSVEDFKKTAERIAATDYQMNTHAIGDSANVVVLKTYRELLNDMPDRRWRVEHAQIISPADFEYFDRDRILPSVQPTHATSDMYWAEDRVGAERIKGAYAYQKLLDQSGMLALGTDYPVEQVNPFLTFYAAVARQDTTGYPEGGFNPQDAISREDALRGMTIWAAYSNFEEEEKGSLEKGKSADFMILKEDLMNMPIQNVPNLKVVGTYINGEKVY